MMVKTIMSKFLLCVILRNMSQNQKAYLIQPNETLHQVNLLESDISSEDIEMFLECDTAFFLPDTTHLLCMLQKVPFFGSSRRFLKPSLLGSDHEFN